MTKVIGTLFDDGRDGFIIIKPSKPFFGCAKHEKRYPVNGGSINIELAPTPPGVQYLVGFKDQGDFTRTDFTLRWRVPAVDELDITPKKPKQTTEASSGGSIGSQVQIKALAQRLGATLKDLSELEHQLGQKQRQLDDITSQFDAYKVSSIAALSKRDARIAQLQDQNQPEIQTVVKEVPVPDAPLHTRIKFLEQQLKQLEELNSVYYKDVIELHQLKLDRAQSLPSPGPISLPEDNPRQRLFNKLLNR